MHTTPCFPEWAGAFAAQNRRLRRAAATGLHPFAALFSRWIATHRLSQEEDGPFSRCRRWPLSLVFWTFLWQVAQAGASCREAIRQAQSLCRLQQKPPPPPGHSPYCQARALLPLERLETIEQDVIRHANNGVAQKDLWCGREVQIVDGTTLTMPDTPANQKAYPQQSCQKKGCGFPILRLVGCFSLATGLISTWTTGRWKQHELKRFQRLWDLFEKGIVFLADRGFCAWGWLAQCVRRGHHAVVRARGSVRTDWRRGRRLTKDQRIVVWKKPAQKPLTVSAWEWRRLPDTLTLRLVRCRIDMPGFRTRQIIVVTTLLDPVLYPPEALSALYYRRWEIELSFRSLKTILQMEHLSGRTPSVVHRELRMHLLVHNLVRCLMLEASRTFRVPVNRLSFAGSLAAARRFAEALLHTSSAQRRRVLYDDLIRNIAEDLVPLRPGRREPRAIKRRPKPFPRLMRPRHHFREIPHQNRYYRNSRFGPAYRKKSRA
ncbi:MAG: IS4 family transposase [bacterium]